MDRMDIGQEIIILRAQNGWTQQQFAQKLKTTQRTVAMWESGASVPRKTMKVKIAQVFGLPEDHFLVEQDRLSDNEDNRNAKMVGEFEKLLLKSGLGLSEKKKAQILEAFQDIMTLDEKK